MLIQWKALERRHNCSHSIVGDHRSSLQRYSLRSPIYCFERPHTQTTYSERIATARLALAYCCSVSTAPLPSVSVETLDTLLNTTPSMSAELPPPRALATPLDTQCVKVTPSTFQWLVEPVDNARSYSDIESCRAATFNMIADDQPHCLLAKFLSENACHPAFKHDIANLQQAAAALRAGQVVAMPTETVYGLAADATDESAVTQIFTAKGRPSDNPLIVHISSLKMLADMYPGGKLDLPPAYHAAIARYWPGPLTLLLPKPPALPDLVTAGLSTMAVRMPAHPTALALITLAGRPLAAPSANSSGRPSPTTAQHVLDDLGGRIPLVVDGGPCSEGVESTVLDALRSPPLILRPGAVSWEDLALLPGLVNLGVYSRGCRDLALEAAPPTPGMKYRHYSPNAKIILIDIPEGFSLHSANSQMQPPTAAPTAPHTTSTTANTTTTSTTTTTDTAAPASQGVETNDDTDGVCDDDAACNGDADLGLKHDDELSGLARLRESLWSVTQREVEALVKSGAGPIGLLRTSYEEGGEQAVAPGDPSGCPVLACPPLAGVAVQLALGPLHQPQVAAQRLYGALRQLDEMGLTVAVVEGVLERGAGLAVMNRLRKAASTTTTVAPSS